MQIGWQRLFSMAFLISALVVFAAMHFWPMSRENPSWRLWMSVGQAILHPRLLGQPRDAAMLCSFLTFSLIIVASPFLGNVWVKSFLAWSIIVIFSGVASAGFWFMIFKGISHGHLDLSFGIRCLMISPALNFVGLLLARPQWLKKSGPSLPPESQAVN